ncbi:Na+/H+ antiporter NhaC family protein [Arenicella xantha]|uniref:Transporter (NhaC family) n=1 Tax=Arenicella xantha TaxID=644221 RepID=A0A395JHD7_9GAMM|nr:Na+/H+ antiporter NhaC family protein [Arenicella xantha]RBP48865.1 transporter (NhaC family) [Arenicella xantha]
MTNLPNWLSLLPATVAIVYVLWRREVVIALALAIFTSEWLLVLDAGSGSPVNGLLNTIERVVSVFSDAGNARLLLFSVLVGALLAYMRFSGGVQATVRKLVNSGLATNARRTGLVTYFTGVVIFIESNLSVLTAGILSRGLFDKFAMSRERLAYIIDSTSAPICILILLNAWGAFILGLIAPYVGEQSAVSVLVATIPLNIYAITTLLLVFYTVWTGKVYGPLARAESSSVAPADADVTSANGRARDMLIPLVVLVFSMLGFMFWTGDGNVLAGSGSKSVLYATVLATTVAFLMLVTQARFTHKQVLDEGFKGMGELLPLVTILLLSIALGASVKQLGTGVFISGLVADYLPLFMVPAIVFIAGAFASFTTGTSWGTFALLVPIAMPIALNLGLPPSLMLAAVLGGGIFGDHCSPVSDTTAVSSLAAGCDILEHVKTQLPYALVAGAITVAAYLIIGLLVV